MRVNTKPGKPTQIKLDKTEQRQLQTAVEILRAIEQHGGDAEADSAQVAAANIEAVLQSLTAPVTAEGEPVPA